MPRKAWRLAKALASYAESAGVVGRLQAALKGIVQTAFQTQALREQVLGDFEELSPALQIAVVRFGKNRDDEELFASLRSRNLPSDARRIYESWAKSTARRECPP